MANQKPVSTALRHIVRVWVRVRTVHFAEVESGLEAGGVVDVVGVERDPEEAGVRPVDTADARRKAAAATRSAAAQTRHLAVDHLDVEVGKLDVVAVRLRVAPAAILDALRL